jgi:hypothetical protein
LGGVPEVILDTALPSSAGEWLAQEGREHCVLLLGLEMQPVAAVVVHIL